MNEFFLILTTWICFMIMCNMGYILPAHIGLSMKKKDFKELFNNIPFVLILAFVNIAATKYYGYIILPQILKLATGV